MKSSHILASIGALILTVIGCGGGSSHKTDLSALEQKIDSEKWSYEPKSYSKLEESDLVTAIFSGGSKFPECSFSDRFKLVDAKEEDGKFKFIFKFEPEENDNPKYNKEFNINCTTKGVRLIYNVSLSCCNP